MKKPALGVFGAFVVALFALSMSATAAVADSIDFNFQNGVLSYNSVGVVTGTVTASSLGTGTGPQLQVARNGTTNLGPYAILGSFSFTTGAFVSGNGSPSTPFDWAAGGSITVNAGSTAMVNGMSLAGDGLFSGMFTGAQSATINSAANTATFTADFVGGSVNAALLTALGFPAADTSVVGVLTENFVITSAPGQPITASLSSGDLTLTPTASPVPEPRDLFLLGLGLLGIAAIARRRLLNG